MGIEAETLHSFKEFLPPSLIWETKTFSFFFEKKKKKCDVTICVTRLSFSVPGLFVCIGFVADNKYLLKFLSVSFVSFSKKAVMSFLLN